MGGGDSQAVVIALAEFACRLLDVPGIVEQVGDMFEDGMPRR